MVFEPGSTLTDVALSTGLLIGRVVFQAERAVAQLVAAGSAPVVADAIIWDTIILDLLAGWAAGTPTRYTPTVAGWYEVSGGVGWASSSNQDVRGSSWALNGNTAGSGYRTVFGGRESGSSNATVLPAQTTVVPCNGTSDFIELVPIQDSGGSLNTNTGSGLRPNMIVKYAGPAGTAL